MKLGRPRHRIAVAAQRRINADKEREALAAELREHVGAAPGAFAFSGRVAATKLAWWTIGAVVVCSPVALATLAQLVSPLLSVVVALVSMIAAYGAVFLIGERLATSQLRLHRERVLALDEITPTSAAGAGASSAGVPGAGRVPNRLRAARWAIEDRKPRLAFERLGVDASPAAAAMRSFAHLSLGETSEGRTSCQRALGELQRGDDPFGLAYAVMAGNALGLRQEVIALATRVMSDDEPNYAVALAAGQAALALDTDEALAQASVILAPAAKKWFADPTLFDVNDEVRLRIEGSASDADFDRLGGLITRSQMFLRRRGIRRLSAANFVDAIRDLSAARSGGDDDGKLYWLLAEACRGAGELRAAKQWLERSPKQDDVMVHLQAGRIAELEGRADDARARYRRAVEIDPSLVERVVHLTERASKLGKLQHEIADAKSLVTHVDLDEMMRSSLLARLDAIGRE